MCDENIQDIDDEEKSPQPQMPTPLITAEQRATIIKSFEKWSNAFDRIPSFAKGDERLSYLGWYDDEVKIFKPPVLSKMQNVLNLADESLLEFENRRKMENVGFDKELYHFHTNLFASIKTQMKFIIGEDSCEEHVPFQVYIARTKFTQLRFGSKYALYVGSSNHPGTFRWKQHRQGGNQSGALLMQKYLTAEDSVELGNTDLDYMTLFSLPNEFRQMDLLTWFEARVQVMLDVVKTEHGLNFIVGRPGDSGNDDKGWLNSFKTGVMTYLDTQKFPIDSSWRAWIGHNIKNWRNGALSDDRNAIFSVLAPIFGFKKEKRGLRTLQEWLDEIIKYDKLYGVNSISHHWGKEHEHRIQFGNLPQFISRFKNGEIVASEFEIEYIRNHSILKILCRDTSRLGKFKKGAIEFVTNYLQPYRDVRPGKKFPEPSRVGFSHLKPNNGEKYLPGRMFISSILKVGHWDDTHKEVLKEIASSGGGEIYLEIIDYIDKHRDINFTLKNQKQKRDHANQLTKKRKIERDDQYSQQLLQVAVELVDAANTIEL
jgi:hypothetical protein